ncbi:MAG: hypothetical protein ABGY75_18175, partial [Gemmataceae bacterium]
MAGSTGAEKGVVLLRALPADLAEQLLTRMDTAVAGPLRDGLAGLPPADEPSAALDDAMAEFFDLQRILDRGLLLGPPDADPAGAGGKGKKAAGGVIDLEPAPVDPIVELRELSHEQSRLGVASGRRNPGITRRPALRTPSSDTSRSAVTA